MGISIATERMGSDY